jgi:hypothetical protein
MFFAKTVLPAPIKQILAMGGFLEMGSDKSGRQIPHI